MRMHEQYANQIAINLSRLVRILKIIAEIKVHDGSIPPTFIKSYLDKIEDI